MTAVTNTNCEKQIMQLQFNRLTDGRTYERINGQTNGQADGRTEERLRYRRAQHTAPGGILQGSSNRCDPAHLACTLEILKSERPNTGYFRERRNPHTRAFKTAASYLLRLSSVDVQAVGSLVGSAFPVGKVCPFGQPAEIGG